jgi:uncharacterized protein (DUF1015 family)
MKVKQQGTRSGKHDLHGKTNKELENERHSHMLLIVSFAKNSFLVIKTHSSVC